jgi:hypothetical protein
LPLLIVEDLAERFAPSINQIVAALGRRQRGFGVFPV